MVNAIKVSEDRARAILDSMQLGYSALIDAVQQYWVMAATRRQAKWMKETMCNYWLNVNMLLNSLSDLI